MVDRVDVVASLVVVVDVVVVDPLVRRVVMAEVRAVVALVVFRVASSHSDSASGTHGGRLSLKSMPSSQTPVPGTPFAQLM